MHRELRHDIRPGMIQRDAALDEPGQEMQSRAQMDADRDRRKPGSGKMLTVALEHRLMWLGIQKPPSSDRRIVFVHGVLREGATAAPHEGKSDYADRCRPENKCQSDTCDTNARTAPHNHPLSINRLMPSSA